MNNYKFTKRLLGEYPIVWIEPRLENGSFGFYLFNPNTGKPVDIFRYLIFPYTFK